MATPADLHREIAEYLRQGLKMPDVEAKARECQARIDQDGYRWDRERMLWRAPVGQILKSEK